MRRSSSALALVCVLSAAAPAHASFPYAPQGAVTDYTSYRLPPGSGKTPNDLTGKRVWMYASTPASPGFPPNPLVVAANADPRELYGVRGAHVADVGDVDQAWRTTTGRPDVTIAILDSGIKWNDAGAMEDVRRKTRISRGETPAPRADRGKATEPGVDCDTFTARGRRDRRDLDGNGVFNLIDYACDARVSPDPPRGVGPKRDDTPVLDPQDVLIAFTDGADDDRNGHPDDIVGWDFLDDDNDPYDDVQYGHGTGEARDSAAEADNGGELGTCPNCTEIHLRVGTSFVADVNRFAQAAIYAADNGVLVIQEALGTLNKSALGRRAVDYATAHGVTVIASAADESAAHNNWPSSYPGVILVNSVTHTDGLSASYLEFNGCTNFNAKIDLAIPSVSCSSDATGRAAGMAGLVLSAALNARASGALAPHPACRRTDGRACLLSAAEVKAVMASGRIGDTPVADDVNFAATELSCPLPGCTDPFLAAPTLRLGNAPPRSYPARAGHDQFYGYGRVNMNRTVDAVAAGAVPPEAELTAPDWYAFVDPRRPLQPIDGRVWARGRPFTCRVLAAPGGYPGENDFKPVGSGACDGATPRSAPLDGVLATLDTAALKALYPPASVAGDFDGPEHGALGLQPHSGRPNTEPYAFTVRLEVTVAGDPPLTGRDRRKLFLHRDPALLEGFPIQLRGDVEASPLLADLDGDNRNELVVANSDGLVLALRPDGSQLPGFPARTDPLARQTSRAYRRGLARGNNAVLATPAAGDLDHDGDLELVVADMEGIVSVFDHRGRRVRRLRANPRYAGIPAAPFRNIRAGRLNRTQPGFMASPVLADLDGDDGGRLEIIAAAMDRHVYAWHDNGKQVAGWPVLVVDRSKVDDVDPLTHRVKFKPGVGAEYDQGALIDTPAVGDLTGDGRPEVVVGSNESYAVDHDGGLNAGGLDATAYSALGSLLELANGRVFAIRPDGEAGGGSPFLPGWPFKVGLLQAGVLPLVGEGITGSPVIGHTTCGGESGAGPRVGVIASAGLGYLVGPDGRSCLGRNGGKDVSLAAVGAVATDQPLLAAFGHPAFGLVGGATTFLAPATGLQRALDVVLPEYQGGHDYLAAWQPASGQLRLGWPAEVNDLQFLTGPSVADIDPASPGEEVIAASASHDLQAFTALGTDVAGFPKLTGDWTVANPTIGTFGNRHVLVAGTRSGLLSAYATRAGACAAASWPRFHHDNANSGDARRDAIPPGRPQQAALAGAQLRVQAPGDDLLCGRARRYEVVTSAKPISARSFAAAQPLSTSVRPGDPGAEDVLALTGRIRRYVAVRAVDEQGNVGLPTVVR